MKSLSLSQIGKRAHNEDYYYPTSNMEHLVPGLFIVCDGVGGAAKGEIASQLVCQYVSSYFSEALQKNNNAIPDVEAAVAFAETALDAYTKEQPQSQGMATTFTLAYIHNSGVTIAHIGDSRVYVVREQKIIFKTNDHSLVNELVASGFITEEDAKTHPKKNVITKAISGTTDATKPDIVSLPPLQKGDMLLLCTDGILESITDDFIAEEIGSYKTLAEKIAITKAICEQNSKDNYTCILVEIEQEEKRQSIKQENKATTNLTNSIPTFTNAVPEKSKSNTFLKIFLFLGLLGILAFIGWKYIFTAKAEKPTKPVTERSNTSERPKPNAQLQNEETNRADPAAVPQRTVPTVESKPIRQDNSPAKPMAEKETDLELIEKIKEEIEQLQDNIEDHYAKNTRQDSIAAKKMEVKLTDKKVLLKKIEAKIH
jgi:PPM family protein phosphatase